MSGDSKRYSGSKAYFENLAKQRRLKVKEALARIPRKQLPFTPDYKNKIVRETRLSAKDVAEHPKVAEDIYRAGRLIASLPVLTMWQTEDRPPTDIHFLVWSFLLCALVLPAVAFALTFVAFRTVHWIVAGFRSP